MFWGDILESVYQSVLLSVCLVSVPVAIGEQTNCKFVLQTPPVVYFICFDPLLHRYSF